MEVARRTLVSEEEFLALPETLDKVELIDGEVFVAPSPTYGHQWIAGKLFVALSVWADARTEPVTVGHAPSDIRFAPGRILQPDIYVAHGHVPLDTMGPLDVIPFLCVEVLSRDRRHDRVTKRFVYGAAGVLEYWVVEQTGLVERWTGADLDVAEEVTGVLTSKHLPGFSLDLATLREK
jgi:Uma2 family endonuclease